MIQIEGYPISPQQRLIWHLEGGRGRLRTCSLSALRGELDREKLKASVAVLVARHEILRTRFTVPAHLKNPIQSVADSPEFIWREASLDHESELEGMWRELFQASLSLEDGRLLRVDLLRLHSRQNYLILRLPALACDSAGLQNLHADLWQIYQGPLSPEWDEEPVQYGQFSQWLQSLEEEAEGGRSFWSDRRREMLDHEPARIDKDAGFNPAWVFRGPIPNLAEMVNRKAVAIGTTNQAFLLTAWQTLLMRSLDLPATTIATGFDGRSFEELADSVGLFTRLLPITCESSQESGFQDQCRQVEAKLSRVQEWQHFFDLESRPAFDLFPFAFELTPMHAGYESSGLTVEVLRLISVESVFHLKLSAREEEHGLSLTLYFDAAHFSREDAERLADRLKILIEAAPEKGEAALGALPMLTSAERQKLLLSLNPPDRTPSRRRTLPSLIETKAAQAPDRVALVFENVHVSFGALNSRANHLAFELRGRDVAPESLVALHFERCADMILGLLGIHKAGAGYLPLDPTLPEERRAWMAADSGTHLWITHRGAQSPAAGIEVLDLQSVCRQSRECQDPRPFALPENLAYAIYTSGSTGKPKAVCVTHNQLVHYLDGAHAHLQLDQNASLALVSTLAADLGHTMTFAALCLGRTLHILSTARITRPQAFADYMQTRRVDCIKLTPSHLDALLHQQRPERALPARQLILGGEACGPALLQKIRSSRPGLRIHNHYGPTETAVGVATCRLDDRENESPPPLGKALPHARLYLTNRFLQLAPQGMAGEILIGGNTLCRGYLGRPDLTARAFSPNPFANRPGARLYHSGDLARLGGGELEFLGRGDDQIKIRGYRVEPGEVRARLNRLPGIRESLVVPGRDGMLAAYYLAGPNRPEPAELRAALRLNLPEYMVPSHLLALEAWPLSANGKIDRKALPRPVSVSAPLVAPSNATERELVSIWQDILGKSPIGTGDHFFELGGHSLLMVKLMSAIEQRFSQRLPVTALFQHPTVAALAACLHTRSGPSPLVILNKAKAGDLSPWILVHPIGGQVHWYMDLARALGPRRPVLGLQAPALLDDSRLFSDLRSMAAYYVRLVLERQPRGPFLLAGWSEGGVIAFEMACQLAALEPKTREVRLVMIDSIHWPSVGVRVREGALAELSDFLGDFTTRAVSAPEEWLALLEPIPAEQRFARAAARLAELDLLPAENDGEYLQTLFRVYRCNRHAAASYRPGSFGGATLLIRAEDSVQRFKRAAPGSPLVDDYGWQNILGKVPRVQDIEGDHYSIFKGVPAQKLADLLQNHARF